MRLTTPLCAGRQEEWALLGTLLRRYLKPGGSGIFLLDIHCYDPPEWCASPRCQPSVRAAQLQQSCSQGLRPCHLAALFPPGSLTALWPAQPARRWMTDQIAKGTADRGARRSCATQPRATCAPGRQAYLLGLPQPLEAKWAQQRAAACCLYSTYFAASACRNCTIAGRKGTAGLLIAFTC